MAGGEIQALQSSNEDQHRDRISRFGLLKHRSKLQEQFLWTQVDFKTEGENEISNKALKAATKLKGCGQFLLFRNYYTINQIKLEKLITVLNICFALCALVLGCTLNETLFRSYSRINASESTFKARIDHFYSKEWRRPRRAL